MGVALDSGVMAVCVIAAVPIAVSDARRLVIPDEWVALVFSAAVAFTAARSLPALWPLVFRSGATGLLLFLVRVLVDGRLGFGDVKYGAALAAGFRPGSLVAIGLLACAAAFLYLASGRDAGRFRRPVPFGSMLALASVSVAVGAWVGR